METRNKNMKFFNCEICDERKLHLNNPKDNKNTFICDRCEKESKELSKYNNLEFCRFSKQNNVSPMPKRPVCFDNLSTVEKLLLARILPAVSIQRLTPNG